MVRWHPSAGLLSQYTPLVIWWDICSFAVLVNLSSLLCKLCCLQCQYLLSCIACGLRATPRLDLPFCFGLAKTGLDTPLSQSHHATDYPCSSALRSQPSRIRTICFFVLIQFSISEAVGQVDWQTHYHTSLAHPQCLLVYHLIVTSWYRYRNRGFWLMSFYWLTFGHDTIMILITVASVLSHTQYVVTMAQAVCAALNIRFFTIPWYKDNWLTDAAADSAIQLTEVRVRRSPVLAPRIGWGNHEILSATGSVAANNAIELLNRLL